MATETATETIARLGDVSATKARNEPEQARSPRHVTTTLNYYRDPGDGSAPTPVYVGKTTVKNERPAVPKQTVVYDVTGREQDFKLDTHGFQFIHHKSQETEFESEEKITTDYYAECEQLYKEVTGATKVRIFGHSVRRGPTHWHSLGAGNASNKGPLHKVHVDQSYAGAEIVLRKHLPEHVEEYPLAVASAPSIADADLLGAKLIYTNQEPPLNRNETWTVLPGEAHEWYYKNEQEPHEVLLIKCFDSRVGVEGLARRAPHSAFRDPGREGEEWGNRESIEVRGLLVFD